MDSSGEKSEECLWVSVAVCVCEWVVGWGVNKRDFCRVNDGQSVMEGERDLINQVNPFLRSLVVSVEMQFEKRVQTACIIKQSVFRKHSGCFTSFQWILDFLCCKYYLCQGGYVFSAVCLFVSRIMEKLLAWFSWNLVDFGVNLNHREICLTFINTAI